MFSNDVFVMDAIIGYRKFHGVNQYQVKWRDWPLTAATWEPWNNILDPSADILLQMAACKCKWELAHKSAKSYPHHSEDTILSTLDMGRLKVLENVLTGCVFVRTATNTRPSTTPRKRRKVALASTAKKPSPAPSPENSALECSGEEVTDFSGDEENIWDYQSPRRSRPLSKDNSEQIPASDDAASRPAEIPPRGEAERQIPANEESDFSIADSLLASTPMTTAEDLRLSFLKSRIKTALSNLSSDTIFQQFRDPPVRDLYTGLDDGHTISTVDSSKRARSVSPPLYETIINDEEAGAASPSSSTTSPLCRPSSEDQSPANSPPSIATAPIQSVSNKEDRFARPPQKDDKTSSLACRIIKFTNLNGELHVIYEVDGDIRCDTHEDMRKRYSQELLSYWLSTRESAT